MWSGIGALTNSISSLDLGALDGGSGQANADIFNQLGHEEFLSASTGGQDLKCLGVSCSYLPQLLVLFQAHVCSAIACVQVICHQRIQVGGLFSQLCMCLLQALMA